MNNFHFLRPEWFLALLPSLLLLFWFARRHLRSRSWQAVCDPELLPHLLLGRSVRRANWPLWLLLLGLLLAVLALAGPVWKRQPQPLFRQQSALVILFDLSRSMQVADLKPSRFVRAQLKISDLLRQRKEGQTALIVFAADAFTVTPLTEDRHTIEALLKSLDPELMPVQGSNPARAIARGQELLQQAGLKRGRLLLVTDEDRPELFLDAARQLKRQGFELAVLGVGSPEGAPIPQPGGGFFKDEQGNLVLPKLNTAGLRQLASAGGGHYRQLSVDDSDLDGLLANIDDHRLDQSEQTTTTTGDRWREEGIWLLWPLSVLAALAFRRGWLLVLTLLLLVPPSAEAVSWSGLWKTPDQRAAEAFADKDYADAAQQFQDQHWKASALYRDGKFSEAAKLLKSPQNADDWYNQGNALAKSGDLPAALKAYQQALKLESEHADAQFNKELVEKALQQQQQQNKKNQQGEQNQQGKQQKQTDNQQNTAEKGDNQAQEQQRDSSSPQKNKDGKMPPQSQSAGEDNKSKSQKSSPQDSAKKTAKADKKSTKAARKQLNELTTKSPENNSVTAEAADKIPETAEQRESRLLLQQIPDDPGGLLRRKFLYQYRQRGQQPETDRSW